MRSAFVCFLAVVLAGVAGTAYAADAQTEKNPPEVGYEDAIRCAAIDTVISSVFSMKDASSEEKKLSLQYDKLIEHWIKYAIGLKGKDIALNDYGANSENLAEQVKKAADDAEIERVIFAGMAKCAELEKGVELNDEPAGISSATASPAAN